MEPQETRDILTPDQLADWLQVGPQWVLKNTLARRLPGQFKAGRSWRYDRAAIEKHRLTYGDVLLPKRKR